MTQEIREIIDNLKTFLPADRNEHVSYIFGARIIGLSDEEKLGLLFWIVWDWATRQEWWLEFNNFAMGEFEKVAKSYNIMFRDYSRWLTNPTRFPKLIVDFLREREGNNANIQM